MLQDIKNKEQTWLHNLVPKIFKTPFTNLRKSSLIEKFNYLSKVIYMLEKLETFLEKDVDNYKKFLIDYFEEANKKWEKDCFYDVIAEDIDSFRNDLDILESVCCMLERKIHDTLIPTYDVVIQCDENGNKKYVHKVIKKMTKEEYEKDEDLKYHINLAYKTGVLYDFLYNELYGCASENDSELEAIEKYNKMFNLLKLKDEEINWLRINGTNGTRSTQELIDSYEKN